MLINMILPGAGGGSSGELVEFTYSGNYTDNRVNGVGTVRFNTSGTLTVTSGTATVSAYILGAGGGGSTSSSQYVGSSGGGGGNQTVSVELAPGTYEIIIGSGGAVSSESSNYVGGNGGDTTAFGYTSTGGIGGSAASEQGGQGGTPNGGDGDYYEGDLFDLPNVTGGSPNGGAVVDGYAQPGGDGYVELTFI